MVKLIPKSAELLQQMYCWNLDYDLRMAMGGTSVAQPLDVFTQSFDHKYDGIQSIMVGVADAQDRIVGCFCLEDMDFKNLRCYLHTTFPNEYTQHVSKAFGLLCDFVFKELHFKNLYTHVCESNDRAFKAALKHGFKQVAELPDYFSTLEGFRHCRVLRLIPEARVV